MPNARILIGPGDMNARGPAWSSAEHAALEYFHNRASAGVWAPRPPVHRWRPAEREAFLRELRRLEEQHERACEQAVEAAKRRSDEQASR